MSTTERALIVSKSEKGRSVLAGILGELYGGELSFAETAAQAQALLSDNAFELCVINAIYSGDPSLGLISDGYQTQFIVITDEESFEETDRRLSDMGVFTLRKPVSKTLLSGAARLCRTAYRKTLRLKNENHELICKIEDMKLVDRAKCLLIQYFGMKEGEAHRYIEKQAMDMRISRASVAESILKTYDS